MKYPVTSIFRSLQGSERGWSVRAIVARALGVPASRIVALAEEHVRGTTT